MALKNIIVFLWRLIAHSDYTFLRKITFRQSKIIICLAFSHVNAVLYVRNSVCSNIMWLYVFAANVLTATLQRQQCSIDFIKNIIKGFVCFYKYVCYTTACLEAYICVCILENHTDLPNGIVNCRHLFITSFLTRLPHFADTFFVNANKHT